MTEPTLLVVLQNAYDKGRLQAGARFNPATWRAEFLRSATGSRLRVVLTNHEDMDIRFCNAAPGIGEGSSSRLKGCPSHVTKAVERARPDLILACGEVAETTVRTVWSGDMIVMPHPAYRFMTRELLIKVRRELGSWKANHPRLKVTTRVALRQKRGFIQREVFHV